MANEALASWYPTARFTATMPQPAQGGGAFVLNGASNPTQVFGIVESVRRLVDAGARPFFRVKVNTRLALRAGTTMIVASVRGTAITDELSWNIVDVTAAPASARDDSFEFDIAILNAGVPVDTAGFRAEFIFASALSNPREVS